MKKIFYLFLFLLFFIIFIFDILSTPETISTSNINSKFDEIAKRWIDARNRSPDITTAMKDACAWEQIDRNNLSGSFRIDNSIMGGPFDRKETYDRLDEGMKSLKISMSQFAQC